MLYFALVKSKANKKLLKGIGKRVRKIRENQGISQAQLAFESGIHRDHVGRIELGKQNPTISTLDAIADALNVQLKELVGEED
ncbi:MAG: XRE family transcriptional regulator [Bacteroidetes bacterium]|nr:MAG: XRE family transcriptional regulator [Bacteroidota bacterium]